MLYGGYTPNLKPMRGARRRARYLSTGVWQASRQTGPVFIQFFTTTLLSLLTPGSVTFVYIITCIEQHSFQRIPSASRKPCHSNTRIKRLATPPENKTSVPSSHSRAKPYLDVAPSTRPWYYGSNRSTSVDPERLSFPRNRLTFVLIHRSGRAVATSCSPFQYPKSRTAGTIRPSSSRISRIHHGVCGSELVSPREP